MLAKAPKPRSNFPSSIGRLVDMGLSGVSKIFGMGDYVVEENSLADVMGKSGSAVHSVPSFTPMANNRIRHRECLGVVRVPLNAGFNIIQTLVFNPTHSATFPWLSSMANGYTSYRVHGAALIYESNTSEYSTTPYMGTICLGTKYDTREGPFTSMVEMQGAKFSVSAKPSQNILHPLECKKGFQQVDTWLCRRGGELSTTFLYDKCTMYVATEGITATAGTVLGRLWLTYDIELINPVLPLTQETAKLRTDWYKAGWGGGTTDQLGSYDNMFYAFGARGPLETGTSLVVKEPWLADATTGIYCDTTNNRFVIIRPGTYVFCWNVKGSGFGTSSQNPFTVTNRGSAESTYYTSSAVYTDTFHPYTLVVEAYSISNNGTDNVYVGCATLTGTPTEAWLGLSVGVQDH